MQLKIIKEQQHVQERVEWKIINTNENKEAIHFDCMSRNGNKGI